MSEPQEDPSAVAVQAGLAAASSSVTPEPDPGTSDSED